MDKNSIEFQELEVTVGQDCGLNIESFNDIKVGDIVEGYEQVEVKRK